MVVLCEDDSSKSFLSGEGGRGHSRLSQRREAGLTHSVIERIENNVWQGLDTHNTNIVNVYWVLPHGLDSITKHFPHGGPVNLQNNPMK